jgi:protein-L-isoaspartate(D-aspartate) O-methyltransferase
MVERQIARRGIHDARLLAAMSRIPREAFLADDMQEHAYEDSPLPIEAGQTISQPYIVALMIQAAQVGPGDRVLEIGAGSGYAAAVMAALAGRVYTIERHAELAELARRRHARLGYRNIEVRTGDGTHGWPEVAPFDAILAAAGAPAVPDVLRRQLAIGGRLIIPVGERSHVQRLIKVTRVEADRYTQEDLGAVRFVPLIGSHGWSEEGGPANAADPVPVREDPPPSIPQQIRAALEPLPPFDDVAFGRLFDRYAGARVVLLGEASHGTSEFYQARAAITRHLIEAHDFRIVAVEADWPDAAAINRHVRHQTPHEEDAQAFHRFPLWMWRNREVDAFVRWLRDCNAGRHASEQAGFFGLDLYSLQRSIRAVIDYLDRVDPDAAQVARRRYGCLAPWAQEPAQYGRMALSTGYAMCEKAVVQMLRELLEHRLSYVARDGAAYLEATQNARLVTNAEAYYRAMYYGAAESWNLRDRHMFETLLNLLHAHGPDARAVVWAHNSHIGDARQTEMGQVRDELNLGQLCREHFGDEVALIGFGTHTGTVAAADNWDEPMQVMPVQPSLPDSYERLFHEAQVPRGLLDLREGQHPVLRTRLLAQRLERFIGVIYRRETERWSHYTGATLPRQFDGYVWFDETRAVSPLPGQARGGTPETWPSGL